MPAALLSSPMPAPFWGVVNSLPKRERFAAKRVEALGYPVFLPLVQTKRASVPLFAGYFFAQISEQWRSITTCFGVRCLVRTADCPARCPDSEIDNLKAMIVGGFVRLPEAPPPLARRTIAVGSKVKITGGAFGGMSDYTPASRRATAKRSYWACSAASARC